ncbi:DUF2306 domain-containing protein [Chitinophaga sp. Mgbs1]|uniref:DUF2306 domain-containing protein n=1 Tax=Chitinophaga solisilvae TaxID=1233460 RepID=A0A433WKD2_9BACT|nr:DUF2306 domain-containing protein [Chitinophaga solisilvae]
MNRDKKIRRMARLLRVLSFLLAAIGLVMVIRRVLVVSGSLASFNPSGGKPFDHGFTENPLLTFIHILPGAIFMLLGPLQFIPRLRSRFPAFHRTSGRIFIISAYITGISAVMMPFVMLPIGGINEAAASILFGCWFLLALSMAWYHILHQHTGLHREWMIRAFATGLAVSTVRPIIALFFGFSGLPPQVFFGTAFWIGFTLHLIIAEGWINFSRRA